MPEGRPLANMGVATNGSETAYSVLDEVAASIFPKSDLFF